MNRSMITALLGAALSFGIAGCDKKDEAPEAKPTAVKSPAKAAEKAPAAEAVKAPPTTAEKPAAAPKNYQVRVVPGEATAGQPATSVVEVTPLPGYKMNLEFPSKMRVEKNAKITATKALLTGDDVAVTEKVLKFTVPYTANEAGKIDLIGAADFSVCNENACKLIRGEAVAWAVNVK